MSAEEARGLLEGATPGPWYNAGYPLRGMDGPEIMGPGDVLLATMENQPRDDANAAIIAAAPDLAATVVALSEERDRLRVILDRARDVIPTGETVLTNDIDVALADYDANFMYATPK